MDKFIPCGDWLPDKPDFGNPGCIAAQNVVPRTKTTFGPMPSFNTIATSALNGTPLGAFSAHDPSGNPGMYVGTTSKLYRGTNGTKPNFTDSSATAYSTPTGGYWSFTEGDGYIYASNGSDAIQRVVTASASNFAALGANAPKAKCIALVQPGFLVCGDINDVTVGIQSQGLRWSALGDATDFPLVGSDDANSKESDWQNVSGPHGRLKAIAPDLSSCNAALFFEQAVFRMIYTGDDKFFNIQPVEKLRGTPAPRSVIQVGQVCYFLSYDGWYAFDGTIAQPIGADRVNKFFFQDCDPNYFGNVSGVADPLSGLCFWTYAGPGNNNGIPNRILVYNPVVGRFSLITGFTGSSLFLGRGFGTSLDAIDALGYNLDTLPFSLDDPRLAGGQIVLGGFDSTNKYGAFTGTNMAFQIDLAEMQLSAGSRSKIIGAEPIVQGSGCSVAVASRQKFDDAVTFSAASTPNNEGVCMQRSDGRYQRLRLTGSAGHTMQHIQGANVTFAPTGKR